MIRRSSTDPRANALLASFALIDRAIMGTWGPRQIVNPKGLYNDRQRCNADSALKAVFWQKAITPALRAEAKSFSQRAGPLFGWALLYRSLAQQQDAWSSWRPMIGPAE